MKFFCVTVVEKVSEFLEVPPPHTHTTNISFLRRYEVGEIYRSSLELKIPELYFM
jgi:hypothetical protein